MAEIPKRLEPISEVKRELFLFSGNVCAFPECSRVIMDTDGNFVGEICHIEAAEKGGERFNPSQTNEDRRGTKNLMLMCHEHHVVTNDVFKFPVQRLQQMKAAHEKKVFEFIEGMSLKVYDVTKRSVIKEPKTLGRFIPKLDKDQIDETLPDILILLSKLRSVPISARSVLAMAVDRGKVRQGKFVVSIDDLVAACTVDEANVHKLLKILDHHELIFDAEDWPGQNIIGIQELSREWCFWEDLQRFAFAGNATLEEIITNLDFSLLD